MTKVIRKQKKVDKYNFPYTFNPYTGCSFGCIYCYSIKSKIWSSRLKNWGIKPNVAKPKPNVVNDLDNDLQILIRIKDKEVQIGNFFEPYPHIESKNKITRECLKLFANKYTDWIVHLETKGNIILRDLDIIKKIKDFQAEITITTLTHDKEFEPYATTTQQRLDVIKELSKNGVFVRVMIMPVLDGYTDINKIKSLAFKYGAKDYKIKHLNYFDIEDLKKQYNII